MAWLGALLTWAICLTFLAGVLWLVWGVLWWVAGCVKLTLAVATKWSLRALE